MTLINVFYRYFFATILMYVIANSRCWIHYHDVLTLVDGERLTVW